MMIAVLVLIAMMPQDASASYGRPSRVKKASIKTYSVTSSSTCLKWKKAGKAKKYRVGYRVNKKGAKWRYKTVKGTKVKISGLSPEKTYAFKVRGVNGWLYGKWSGRIYKKTKSTKKDMLDQVNAQRKKRNLKPLKLYSEISKTSLIKAKDLKKTGSFSHYSMNLGYFNNQFDKAGLIYASGGENIAMGFSTVSGVMKAWMNSKLHRENILDPDYTHLGVGHYGRYWVQQFAQYPKKAVSLTCPYCAESFTEKNAGYDRSDKGCGYTYDSSGRQVYVGICPYCGKRFIKCPNCSKGMISLETFDCNNCSYSFK